MDLLFQYIGRGGLIAFMTFLITACGGGAQQAARPLSTDIASKTTAPVENNLSDMSVKTIHKTDRSSIHDTPAQTTLPATKISTGIARPKPAFRVADLTLGQAHNWLGRPDLVREEQAGQILRWAGLDCQLYMVIFEEKIDHVEAWNVMSGKAMDVETCGTGLMVMAK